MRWLLAIVLTAVNIGLFVYEQTQRAPRVYVCIVHTPPHNGDRVKCR